MTHFNQDNTSGYTDAQLALANEFMATRWPRGEPMGLDNSAYKRDAENTLFAVEFSTTLDIVETIVTSREAR